jgi:hypothetical protein
MSLPIQWLRNVYSYIQTVAWPQASFVFDTTFNRLHLQDGSTNGGFPTALETYTAVNDANYTVKVTDRNIFYSALTAARVVSLPAVSTFPPGVLLTISDIDNLLTSSHTLTLTANGSDTIAGAGTAVMNVAGQVRGLRGDGVSKWSLEVSQGSFALGNLTDVSVTDGSTAAGSTLVYNGSAWVAQSGATPPTTALWSYTANGTSATQSSTAVAAKGYTVQRTDGGAGSTYRSSFVGQAVPSGSAWSATAHIRPNMLALGTGAFVAGVALYDPTSGNFIIMGYSTYQPSYGAWLASNLSSNISTTVGATAANSAVSNLTSPEYWSVVYNGSKSFSFYYSWDGVFWYQLGSAYTFSNYSTSCYVGVGLFSNGTFTTLAASVMNWLVDNTATPGG